MIFRAVSAAFEIAGFDGFSLSPPPHKRSQLQTPFFFPPFFSLKSLLSAYTFFFS